MTDTTASTQRGLSTVTGAVLLVGIVVIVAGGVAVTLGGFGDDVDTGTATGDFDTVAEGDTIVSFDHTAGTSINTDALRIHAVNSTGPNNEFTASEFGLTSSIGETFDPGETITVDLTTPPSSTIESSDDYDSVGLYYDGSGELLLLTKLAGSELTNTTNTTNTTNASGAFSDSVTLITNTVHKGNDIVVEYDLSADTSGTVPIELRHDAGTGDNSSTDVSVPATGTVTKRLTVTAPGTTGTVPVTGTVNGTEYTATVTVADLTATPSNPSQTLSKMNGSGTAADPYQVTNAYELNALRSDPDASFKIAADVDASVTSNWNSGDGFTPIGTQTQTSYTYSTVGDVRSFTAPAESGSNEYDIELIEENIGENATFDVTYTSGASNPTQQVTISQDTAETVFSGSNHAVTIKVTQAGGTIRNFETDTDIDVSSSDTFTGVLNGSERRVIGLHVAETDASTYNGYAARNALLRYNDGVVENAVFADADVTGDNRVGVVAGENTVSGTIRDVTVTDTNSITGRADLGGVAGVNRGVITDAAVTADVKATTDENGNTAGGIAASVRSGGVIQDSTVDATVKAEAWNTGLAAGTVEDGTIDNVTTTGTVASPRSAGGIVGLVIGSATVSDSSTSAAVVSSDVSGKTNIHAGGAVGYVGDSATIDSVSATGSVTGGGSATLKQVGGLVGTVRDTASIQNSDASGSVTGSESVGGLVGEVGLTEDESPSISSSSASGDVTGNESVTGAFIGYDVVDDRHGVDSGGSGSVTELSAPFFDIQSVTPERETVSYGETVNVTTEITNTGSVSAGYEVETGITGSGITASTRVYYTGKKTVVIDSGETKNVTIGLGNSGAGGDITTVVNVKSEVQYDRKTNESALTLQD